MVSVKEVMITPAIAAGLLEHNTCNRPMRKALVAALARDMLAGNWREGVGTIVTGADGSLLDGQHRLAAIEASKTSQRMIVVSGLAPESMTVIDTGAKRGVGDTLAIGAGGDWENVSTKMAAAVARIGVLMDSGQYVANGKPTASEIVAWASARPSIKVAVRRAAATAKSYEVPPAVVGYAMWRTAEIDTFASAEFFDDWAQMRSRYDGDPIGALMRRLRSANANNEKVPRPAYLAAIFRAWNARRAGQTMERMQFVSRGGIIEIPEPK